MVAKAVYPNVWTTMGHLMASRPLEILAFDFSVLVMDEKMFLWLQMCFQSLHRPTPQKIKELVRWPVSWPRGCFTCMVYQHVFILIKAEILKESCLNTCATFMACRRVDLQLIIQRGMANVSVSITHYMICFVHCQKIRTKSGLSFYRSYFLHTTPLLIDQRVTLLMS